MLYSGVHSSTRSGNGCSRASAERGRCTLVEALVASAFAIPPRDLRMRTRGEAAVAFARQTAMYLAHVSLGLSLSEVGRAFGRDRTTAAHACRVVEERRDDPRIDALLTRLESAWEMLGAIAN
jgi:chromosomal replication initiation ATPase DnaA